MNIHRASGARIYEAMLALREVGRVKGFDVVRLSTTELLS